MNSTKNLLLVYGGTFDPVHVGHVAVARAAVDASGSRRVLLIPCGDPPHRSAPLAPGELRAELLRLAFAGDSRFVVDERELRRAGPSYMVDTLADLRSELGESQPIALLLGQDAARGLPSWHAWPQLPTLAHLLLVPRPGGSGSAGAEVEAAWPAVTAVTALLDTPAGRRWTLPHPLSDASSTRSRRALAGGNLDAADLPEAVRERLRPDSPYLQPRAPAEK